VLTIWRHYSARFLRAFVTSLAILALMLVAVDAMLHLAALFEEAETPRAAIRFLFERAAGAYAEFVIPFAAFAAAFWCAGTAALSREVLALKAGGVSPLAALAPVVLLALLLSSAHAQLVERAGVPAAAALATRKNPGSGDTLVQSGGLWFHVGRVVYSAGSVDGASGAVRDIRVYERNAEGRLVRTIHAQRGVRLAPQRWEFEDAWVRELDPEALTQPPRERREARVVLELASDRSPQLRASELPGLAREELRAHAAQRAGDAAGFARVALANRESGPWAVPLFAAVAIPLALRSEERRSLARAAAQGAALVVGYVLARDVGSSFAAREPALAGLFPWLTLAAVAAFGLLKLARVSR
jgi:lipopolysaccharide export LptBFGC system permease protein LptF